MAIMDMAELRALVAVADTGQLQTAGRLLNRSVGTISSYLSRLESQLGCQLLDRSVRPVVPTPAGRVFIDEARASLEALDRAAATAQRIAETGSALLRIGHNGTTGLDTIHHALTALDPTTRDLVRLSEGPSDTLVERLLTFDLDVAVVRPPLHHPDLEESLLANEPLALLVPAGHHLADHRAVHLAQLSDEEFLLPPRTLSAGYHDHIVNACHTHGGFTPRLADEATTAASFVALTAAGVGITILPRPALTYCKTTGTKTLRILDPIPPAPLHLAWNRHNTNPHLLELRNAITDAIPQPP